jgi:hypothetical protein
VSVSNKLFFVLSGSLLLSFAQTQPAPVVVELFTSEGCSSCPPADRLLQQLDGQAIVLGEHVDYWDHQGWKDRFSSHAFTERQAVYAGRFHLDGPYTPQMVVDGEAQFVGSDARRAAAEIAQAARRAKAEVKLTRTPGSVRVEVEGAPVFGDVILALADEGAVSEVRAGENQGHTLRHVAIVHSLRKIGTVKRGGGFRTDIALPADAAEQRVVVFVQDAGQGRVAGAAVAGGSR